MVGTTRRTSGSRKNVAPPSCFVFQFTDEVPLNIPCRGTPDHLPPGVEVYKMMRRSLYPLLLAILAALCMLGVQQAAYAHYADHMGSGAAQAASAPAGDSEDAPLHACATCTLLAGLAAAPPVFAPPIAMVHAVAISLPDLPTAYCAARSALPYTARAPPAIL